MASSRQVSSDFTIVGKTGPHAGFEMRGQEPNRRIKPSVLPVIILRVLALSLFIGFLAVSYVETRTACLQELAEAALNDNCKCELPLQQSLVGWLRFCPPQAPKP